MFLKLKSFFFFAFLVVTLLSCDKEYSIEGYNIGGGTSGGTSTFSLDGTPGVCNNASIQGNYMAGVPTTSANNVVLTVNVTVLGTYTLTTSTTNGFSFAGSGTFTQLGFQLIQLNANGTPTNPGVINFRAGAQSCSFNVTVGGTAGGGGGNSGTSVFTLNGNPNACQTPTIAGTYQQGTALTSSNKVTLKANVTTAGTYTITTTNNGMTFTATGTFANTGANQDVVFTGSGTPTAAGSINFAPGAAVGCTFTIPVTPNGGGGGGTIFLKATINGVAYEFNTSLAGTNSPSAPANLFVQGQQSLPAAGTGQFIITFNNSTGVLTTGAYSNPSATNMIKNVIPIYSPAAGVAYSVNSGTNPATNTFSSNLSTYTTTSATGTFTGTLYLNQGTGAATLPLTNGSFSITY